MPKKDAKSFVPTYFKEPGLQQLARNLTRDRVKNKLTLIDLLTMAEQRIQSAREGVRNDEEVDAYLITNLEQLTGLIAKHNLLRDAAAFIEEKD